MADTGAPADTAADRKFTFVVRETQEYEIELTAEEIALHFFARDLKAPSADRLLAMGSALTESRGTIDELVNDKLPGTGDDNTQLISRYIIKVTEETRG